MYVSKIMFVSRYHMVTQSHVTRLEPDGAHETTIAGVSPSRNDSGRIVLLRDGVLFDARWRAGHRGRLSGKRARSRPTDVRQLLASKQVGATA
jgi:hypothetical protein